MNWSVPAVCPVTLSKNYNPTCMWLNSSPECPGYLSPLSLPALTSVLMDITLLFLHLCTQSVPAWGKVSHQYILQLHSSQLQIGEIINTAEHSEVLFVGINSIKLQWLEIVCCDVSLAVYGFVCLFLNFHSCKANIKLKKNQCLRPGEVGEQPYISKEGLR